MNFSSGKPVAGGDPTCRLGTASRKPLSLFSDSDSGDDELLFSSTSSASSRSRRSQGSGDLLTEPGDKGWPTAVPKKGLFDNEDLFGGTKDEPYCDIFSTGANSAMAKPNSLPEENKNGNEDLFSGQLNDPEFNLFRSFDTPTSVSVATPAKLKSDNRDMLFGDDIVSSGGVDNNFDIFEGHSSAESGKSLAQVSGSESSFKDSESVKPSSWGLFPNIGTEDTDNIFSVQINKFHCEHPASKGTLVNSLFSGGSVLDNSKDDLFADLVKPKEESQDIPKTGGFLNDSDDIFSVPRTVSSNHIARNKVVISKDYNEPNSEFVTKSDSARNGKFAEVPSEVSDVISSDIFSDSVDRSGSKLFRSITNTSVDKKPVIANKPVISPKPKLSSVSKPSVLQDTTGDTGNFSSSKINTDKNILQLSNPSVTKERTDNLSAKSEQKTEIYAALAGGTGPSVSPSKLKLKPPNTLNIRKTTGLLLSSSSDEDEHLSGKTLSEKVLDSNSTTEVTDHKPIVNLVPVVPRLSSVAVAKPTAFCTEKRANIEKEISSKIVCSQGKTYF